MRTSQKIGTYILSVLALTGFHSLFAQTNNCDISWLSPVQVSHDSVSSIVPQLSVQGDTIHVLWLNTDDLGITSNDGILYSHSYDGGQSFSPQQKLLSFDSTISSGVFIASQENSVYATFIAIADTFYGTAFTRSTDAGTTWEPVRFLFRTSRPRFIVTQGARVYIHFLNQRNNRYGMLRSDDNGITWQVADSTMPVLSDMVAGQTQLSGVGTIGALTSREVEYYYSNDHGASWVGYEQLSKDDPTPSSLPSIAMNENGDLFAAWNDTGTIVVRRSMFDENEGLVWLPQTVLSNTKGAVFSDIASSDHFVSVVWDNDFGGSGGIRIRPSNESAAIFCGIDLPTNSTTAGAPSLQIVRDKLHLIWSEVVDGNTEIMYRRGILHEPILPTAFRLRQNYPNPFNGSTNISYDLPAASDVTLIVYNLLGQRVATLVDGNQPARHYDIQFDGGNLASGVYFYRLQTKLFTEVKKMLLIR